MIIKSKSPVLESERLLLRRFDENDLDAILDLFGDKEINIWLPWFPVTSPEEARVFYETRYAEAYRRESGYHYAVCLKDSHTLAGYLNVAGEDSHDLGYGLKKEYWGNGIITEACKMVIEQLKRDNIPYITATHDIKNPRSGSVMKRIGMTYRYSYEERWQPKDKLVTFRMYQLNLDGYKERVYRKYWDTYPVHFIETIV